MINLNIIRNFDNIKEQILNQKFKNYIIDFTILQIESENFI